MADLDPEVEALREALAEHFECDPEEVVGWTIACERLHGDDSLTISTTWAAGSIWRAIGMAEWLWAGLRRQREQGVLDDARKAE